MTTVAERTPIVTFQDILNAMARNPELKEQMRQHLQDEELRNLPRTVARLLEAVAELAVTVQGIARRQERTEADVADIKAGQARHDADIADIKAGQARHDADIADIKAGQARHDADIAELKAGQARHDADIAELKAGQARLEAGQARHDADIAELKAGQARLEDGQARHDADIAELKAGQARLEDGQRRMQSDINRLSGSEYERRVARTLRRNSLRHFGIGNGQLVQSITIPNNNHIPDLLDQAGNEGIIQAHEADDAEQTDIVIHGQDGANQPAYVAIEASVTIESRDIVKARERADIISRAAGISTTAAACGSRIDDETRALAGQYDVAVIILPA